MALRLWPQNFENKDLISKEERKLLRNAERNFIDGHFAIGIDPMGFNDKSTRMGMYISPKEGLITFSIIPGNINYKDSETYRQHVEFLESIIYKRLLDSMCLIARNGIKKTLKFPYKHILLFPDALSPEPKESAYAQRLINYAVFGFFKPMDSKGDERRVQDLNMFSGIRKNFDESFNSLEELECKAIFERLAPEYTVVLKEKDNITVYSTESITEEDMLITEKEVEYKIFFLDEYQVGVVNEMGKGHRVVLANPGAGKSVLLLSKAFKYSKVFKDSNILLTCYNANLADAYIFKYSCAGFITKNLYICTFHKLVKKILEECLHINVSKIEEKEIFDCINSIKAGKVKLKFKAIFIDEVQIFDPLYLTLCYLLLDTTNDDYTFLLAGDLNQKIRSSSQRGDAPWKRIDGVKLDFSGRVRYIEKNYRNSKEISEYLLNMLALMNNRFSMLKMISPLEYEYNAFQMGDKPTLALNIKTGIPRKQITGCVLSAVNELIEKYHIAYNDIAILFPYKQHKLVKYFIFDWIVNEFDQNNIPYSVIVRSEERVKYHNTSGVVLSTIESSLGLDFKAVILTGLLPYDFVIDESSGKLQKVPIQSWSGIQKMSEHNKESVQNQMRAMYTACSRAREILYVLSDLRSRSPMEEILKVRKI